ncbi:LEAF RUST 10 DISEASE-RESISTANCE LOCUS RECEPTOR-LIKE PROTEIN [Drosera capensis]
MLELAIPTGAIILIVLIVHREREKLRSFILATLQRKTAVESEQTNIEGGAIHLGGLPIFSYRELEEATNNFDPTRELGNGGFGTVYHGTLRDGRKVAVKRLFEKNCKRITQFTNEVEILTRLRHPNLVTLYGCTSHQSHELILVYEHVTNGTVADHLHGEQAITRSLTWTVRMSIAIETASALSYLHASDIIHRDVKTDNILLDNHFSVKVADFGLSRTFPLYVTHVSTAPQGTPGYLDPEYHRCYQLTDKSDVYSFGVVLVELISSLPAVDMRRHKNEINLSEYAMSKIHQGAFDELLDPELGFESNDKVKAMAISVGVLAFQCLQHNKEFRPSMAEVLEALMRIESATTIEPKIAQVELNDGASESAKHPLTTSEKDDAELIKNDQPPTTPNCVIQQWDSKSTTSTPSTSS